MNYRELCVWGDSIAKGVIFDEARGRYVLLSDSCLKRMEREWGVPVRNYSVMGQTSADGLRRMRASALNAGGIAVIEYGGNDCDLDWAAVSADPRTRQFGKVPIDDFARNLEEMVALARGAGLQAVLVSPPPLIAKRYFEWVSRGLDPDRILQYLGDVEEIFRWQAGYAARARAVAEALDVSYIDIRTPLLQAENLGELICVDGIHPNERGQAAILAAVSKLEMFKNAPSGL